MAILSALIIAAAFLVLAWFIHRLGIVEGQGVVRPLGAPIRTIPAQHMVGVRNPFQLYSASFEESKGVELEDTIKVLFSACVCCYVTPYWGLEKEALNTVILESRGGEGDLNRGGDDSSESAFDDSDDSISLCGDNKSLNPIPLEHLFQGNYITRGSSEFFNPTSEGEISLKVPGGLHADLTQGKLPLVLAMETSRIAGEKLDNSSQIVSLISAMCVPTSRKMCQMITQCVQTADNRFFSMKKLFVSENDSPSENPSQVSNNTQSQPEVDFANSACVICQSMPVTRALLPCRHACICGGCFPRLNACPLCREVIQSYFKVQEEPSPEHVDPEASEELNRMSVWEIAQGVLNAS